MATEEARSLLDSLMGGDRNAPLPLGAAVPRKRKHGQSESGALLLPGKRQKSCFDRDIDPLYTAWGVDVYDLFKNTKSDLGANPYVVDEGAHLEFQQLPMEEQEATGYHYFLFQKLQELVRQCDRTVARNKDKLQQELQRKLSQRGGQDFVEDVDEAAVETLVRDMWLAEDLVEEWKKTVEELDQVVSEEEAAKRKIEPLLEARKAAEVAQNQAKEAETIKTMEGGNELKDEKPNELDGANIQDRKEEGVSHHGNENDDSHTLESLQMELGRLTLQRQRLVFEVSRIISRLAPLQDSVESQHRNLNYVKSDISTDKTVCEVSGNFMSSRDADERIAAHYAGKQYVGWKLVRDKFQEMIQKYGRYGPPPPQAGRDGPQPPQHHLAPPPHRGSYGRGERPQPPPPRGGGGNYNDRGAGRYDSGGHRGGDQRRWDRHGPPGGYPDRGRSGPPRGGGWRR